MRVPIPEDPKNVQEFCEAGPYYVVTEGHRNRQRARAAYVAWWPQQAKRILTFTY